VLAGPGSVRALGTAFAVRRDADRATVVVTEHAVRVAVSGAGETRSADVGAGQAISYSAAGGLEQPQRANVPSLTAWRRGELQFDGRSLGDVVTEVGRYRRGSIFILDEAVRRLPVTGSFDLTDTDAFFDSIRLALPITVTSLPGVVLIRRDTTRALPSR
jgi:transmembrane sensor